MAPSSSPTVRRRRLAAEMRRLRQAAKLTIEQVAELLEWSPGKVSKIENAQGVGDARDARQLLDAYGVSRRPGARAAAVTRPRIAGTRLVAAVRRRGARLVPGLRRPRSRGISHLCLPGRDRARPAPDPAVRRRAAPGRADERHRGGDRAACGRPHGTAGTPGGAGRAEALGGPQRGCAAGARSASGRSCTSSC